MINRRAEFCGEVMSDFIKTIIREIPALEIHLNRRELRIRNSKYRGSLWIRERYIGFRLQTTSDIAGILNKEIERLAGEAQGAQKSQEYKYWYIDDHNAVEKILRYLGSN